MLFIFILTLAMMSDKKWCVSKLEKEDIVAWCIFAGITIVDQFIAIGVWSWLN